MLVLAGASLLPVATASFGPTCGQVGPTAHFCHGVSWNASLPLAASTLDAAAKSDFDQALDRLHKLSAKDSLPLCLESWKGLQCASKFQKCSKELPAQKVSRSRPPCYEPL